jgi:hypothetical protein
VVAAMARATAQGLALPLEGAVAAAMASATAQGLALPLEGAVAAAKSAVRSPRPRETTRRVRPMPAQANHWEAALAAAAGAWAAA